MHMYTHKYIYIWPVAIQSGADHLPAQFFRKFQKLHEILCRIHLSPKPKHEHAKHYDKKNYDKKKTWLLHLISCAHITRRFFAEYTFHPNPNTNTQSIMTNKRHDSYISFHVLILQLQSAHVPWLIDMTLTPHTLHLASHTSHLIHMSLSHLISYTDITMFYFGSALHLVKCWYNNY